VAGGEFALGAGLGAFEGDERDGGIAVAHKPLAGEREIAAAARDEADPVFGLRAFEEHVAIARVAGGERGGALVGGGKGGVGLGETRLVDARGADLREGFGLAGERGVGEVAGVERGEVGEGFLADAVEEVEAAGLLELGAKIAEHKGEQRFGLLLAALGIGAGEGFRAAGARGEHGLAHTHDGADEQRRRDGRGAGAHEAVARDEFLDAVERVRRAGDDRL
jgi:hypothetical protein